MILRTTSAESVGSHPGAPGDEGKRLAPRDGYKRRGLAVVEFEVIAPFLVFLTIGLIELAHGYQVKEVLTDAVRRGGRNAALPSTSSAAIQSDVQSVLSKNNITSADATVTITVNGASVDASTAKTGDQIAVKVSIPVSKVTIITPLFLPGQSLKSETLVVTRN